MILFLFMVCFLMICSTGCSSYDYDRDAPTGITIQEFETSTDTFNYDGSYIVTQSDIKVLDSDGAYTDDNLSIFNLEKRYTVALADMTVNMKTSFCELDLCIDFYNKDKKLISSSEQILQIVPGYVNSVLIQIPVDAEYYALQSYNVTSCRKVNNVTVVRSTELLSRTSNTVSNVKKNTKDVIFFDKDMRVLYYEETLDKGRYINRRTGINYCGFTEVTE